jgi:site-specific recombinase XerD
MNIMNNDLTKFNEYLQIKGYTKSSADSSVQLVNYFAGWAATQGIYEMTEVSYSDVLAFIQYCNERNVAKKTQVIYIRHLNHYYNFLRSEEGVKDNPASHVKIKGVKRKVLHQILSPAELDSIYKNYPVTVERKEGVSMPPQERNEMARKRNKVILGLLIYQGLNSGEIANLKVVDVKQQEGKIYIPSKRRSNSRVLKLEAHQLYDMMDYINGTRKKQLEKAGVQSEKLFINERGAKRFFCMMQSLLNFIRKQNSKVKNLEQIRASVITQWVKMYDLRKAQYLAGHKHVRTTESYKQNNIDELKDDVRKYHPY